MLALPLYPRSLDAPYFSGRVSEPIEDFLSEYEELANSCDLTDCQKVEVNIRYIPLSLRDFWKSLDGYSARNLTDFRLALEGIYERPSAPSRHSEQKLQDSIRHSSKLRMSDEEDVLHYYRQSLVLSKPLLDSQRLSTHQRNKASWRGFHSRDRAEMYARLIAMHPDQPSDVYFDYLDVYKVARATFSEEHILDVELDDPWDEPTREDEDREVEGLMKRMHGLSVHEESYAVLFARCALRFPNVAQSLPKPVFAQHMPTPAPTFSLQVSIMSPPPPPAHRL